MSTVAIKIDGTDITADVVIAGAEFNTQVNGVPGSSKFRIRDNNRTYSITTGKSLTLDIDGSRAWTGYVTQVKRVYQFDAQATNPLPGRFLDIEGVDINILFTRRVVFNKTTPTTVPGPTFGANTPDTTAISSLVTNYLDLSSDSIDTSSMVTGVANVNQGDPWNGWAASYTWADAMNTIIRQPGSIYYLDPSSRLVYCDVDTPTAPYALSDQPAVDGAKPYREMEILYDGGSLDNDHITWGAGYGSKSVVVSRVQDSASQATHGRWQDGAFLSDVYKQTTVDRISNSYVYGSPTNHRGGKDDKVAVVVSTYQPGFRAAQKVTFTSHAYGYSDTLPIRQMQITFPTPTDPKYRLTLSHAIDAPWGFIDQYFPNLNFNLVAPVVGGIGNICLDCVGMTVNVPGTCNCGITDTFTRTVSNGWGTADCGIAYTISNAIASGVDGTAGWLQMAGTYAQGIGDLPVAYGVVADMYFEFKFDTLVGTGKSSNAWVRQVDNNNPPREASVIVSVNSDPTASWIQINPQSGAPQTAIAPSFWTVGQWYSVRFGVSGSVWSARIWKTGTTEPSTWNVTLDTSTGTWPNVVPVTVTDIFVECQGTLPSQTVTYWFDNLDITGIDRCTQYRFDNFNRTVAAGWGTSDYGTAWTVWSNAADFSVDGANANLIMDNIASTIQDLSAGPYTEPAWTMTARLYCSGSGTYPVGQLWFTALGLNQAFYLENMGNVSGFAGDISFGGAGAAIEFVPGTWYLVKWAYDSVSGLTTIKAWAEGTAEPAWMLSTYWGPGGNPITGLQVSGRQSNAPDVLTVHIDYIDFDYTGKPCYQGGPVPSSGVSVPVSGFWCESLTPVGTVLTTSAPYQYGTTEVYKNGLLLANGSDYTETSWTAGTITLAVAPAGETYRVCYVATVISGGGGGGRPLVR